VTLKTLTTLILVTLAFTLLTKLSYAYFENAKLFDIAPNPSFENGSDQPTNWTAISGKSCDDTNNTANGQTIWATDQALSGSKSLEIKDINWPGSAGAIPGSWISSQIPIQYPNLSYNVIVRVKTDLSSKNLSAVLWFCALDNNGERIPYNYRETFPSYLYNLDDGWSRIYLQIIPNTRLSKIVIGLAASCNYFKSPNESCSGNLWFDDILIVPSSGKPTFHAFNDVNNNQVQDPTEVNLQGWMLKFFEGFNCNPDKMTIYGFGTDQNGNTSPFNSTFSGLYSASFQLQLGWRFTTPECQNITLYPGINMTLNFGTVQSPPFPYLSQLNSTWSQNEYDHASQIGPFFCGTTIGGCGCAITSAAMLLKFHGANKSPNGEDTNPDSLNTWLKNNNGYAFGALKWNSVAAYSVKANESFGTQKIRFVGPSGANDFSTLDTDLTNNKPDILSQPGHFIVATKKDGTSYSIADPAYESRKTLDSYSNSFTGMRRFEKTDTDLSALYITTPTPNDLFITDSLGRRAGRDPQTGQILTEIPKSYYFLEPSLIDQTQQNAQTPDSGGVNTLVIINPPRDTFDLQSQSGPIDVSAYDTYGSIKVKNFSPISPDDFEINYSPDPGSDFSVFQKVKIEVKPQNLNMSTGVIPVVIKSDNNFDAQDVDFNSIRFTSAQIIPVKFPLFVQNGNDNKKDLQVFFFANEIAPDPNLCLTGKTASNLIFKGCST